MKKRFYIVLFILWTIIFGGIHFLLVLTLNDNQPLTDFTSHPKFPVFVGLFFMTYFFPTWYLFYNYCRSRELKLILQNSESNPKYKENESIHTKMLDFQKQLLQSVSYNQKIKKEFNSHDFQLRSDINTLNGISSILDDQNLDNKESLMEIISLYRDTVQEMKMKFNSVNSPEAQGLEKKNKVRPLHIVIAEDNLKNQTIIKKILERDGHEVMLFENGRKACDYLKNNECDLILMDCMMPIMDGFQATEEIRKMKNHQTRPIIALTSFSTKKEHERCYESGMNDVVVKPFDIVNLKKAIAKHTKS